MWVRMLVDAKRSANIKSPLNVHTYGANQVGHDSLTEKATGSGRNDLHKDLFGPNDIIVWDKELVGMKYKRTVGGMDPMSEAYERSGLRINSAYWNAPVNGSTKRNLENWLCTDCLNGNTMFTYAKE